MTVTLPSGAGSHHDHNPFPGSLACIIGLMTRWMFYSLYRSPRKSPSKAVMETPKS
ncbi:hypothetical protein OS493_037050 [Desmophyllum pertusum]|uniref:Uncharacterized protein n=1 Tax=Desmophyllum pertusum TaxID=174260 RepID=A0A9W9ZVB3_9CNID|nr:hypothetical protein OS493_037050 [Desmophyllum pertusum]